MPTRIDLTATLGARRCRAGAKDEVIAFLASSNIRPAERREIFRAWCKSLGLAINRRDINDVAPPRSTVKHPQLEFGHE